MSALDDHRRRRSPSARGSATRAVDDVTLHVPHGSFTTVLGPSGCGKTTLLRLIAGFLRPEPGSIAFGDRRVAGAGVRRAAAGAPGRLRPPGGRAVPAPRRGRQHRVRPAAGRARRRRVATASPRCSTSSSCPPTSATGARTSCRAASSSAWRWPARSRRSPPSCSSTSRSPPSTPACAAARRGPCAAPSRPTNTTALLVTHDQNEALSLADQVAVMRAGRLVQVGDAERGLPLPRRPAGRASSSAAPSCCPAPRPTPARPARWARSC